MLYKHRGIITAFLGLLLLLLPPAPFEPSCYFGIPIFFAAIFLRIWARLYIGEHSRGKELACNEIVKTGPYRYIKHPLYLSNFMAGAAFALFHTGFSLATLGFCVIYSIFLAILAINENRFLNRTEPQICLISPASSLKKSAINDLPTWLWQVVMLALIFLRKILK